MSKRIFLHLFFAVCGFGVIHASAAANTGAFYSVKDSGGVRDGITKDTEAIQSAIDAARSPAEARLKVRAKNRNSTRPSPVTATESAHRLFVLFDAKT